MITEALFDSVADTLADMENETPGDTLADVKVETPLSALRDTLPKVKAETLRDTLPDVKAQAIVAFLAHSAKKGQHKTYTTNWLI